MDKEWLILNKQKINKKQIVSVQGKYSPTILKNLLCLFFQDLENFNVKQLLIG